MSNTNAEEEAASEARESDSIGVDDALKIETTDDSHSINKNTGKNTVESVRF